MKSLRRKFCNIMMQDLEAYTLFDESYMIIKYWLYDMIDQLDDLQDGVRQAVIEGAQDQEIVYPPDYERMW